MLNAPGGSTRIHFIVGEPTPVHVDSLSTGAFVERIEAFLLED